MTSFTMGLDELLFNYAPAYGGDTWTEAWAVLDDHRSDTQVVDALRSVLARGDDFNEPVILDEDEKTILNGMHRVYASVLEGRTEINVNHGWLPETETPWWEIEFTAEFNKLDEDPVDVIASSLRSFDSPLGWLNCDSVSSVGGSDPAFFAAWECPEEDLEQLQEIITARAAAEGWSFNVKKITQINWDEI